MSYTKMTTQPALRDPSATGIAPGLYPDEVAVTLDDTGDAVAVFVEGTPTDNNAGIAYYASARAINADGSTILHGSVQIVTEMTHNADHGTVDSIGADVLAKNCVLAVLGEAIQPIPNTDPPQPVIAADATTLANWSIRTMLSASSNASAITTAASV